MERRVSKLNWYELKQILNNINKIILPIGTMEAHGITSIGTDIDIPEQLSIDIAENINALILPTVPYSITSSLLPYPGTININNETFEKYILDIALSLKKDNYKYLIIMNGHGGNNVSLSNIKKSIYTQTGMFVIIIHWWIFSYGICEEIYKTPGGHAGVDETAMMLYIDENTVKKDLLNDDLYYKINRSIETIPSPAPILSYDNKLSTIDLDKNKAEKFYNKVKNELIKNINEIIKQMEKHFT